LTGGCGIDVRPLRSRPPERFHSTHWREARRSGTRKNTVVAKFESHGPKLVDPYQNVFYLNHVFFLFEPI